MLSLPSWLATALAFATLFAACFAAGTIAERWLGQYIDHLVSKIFQRYPVVPVIRDAIRALFARGNNTFLPAAYGIFTHPEGLVEEPVFVVSWNVAKTRYTVYRPTIPFITTGVPPHRVPAARVRFLSISRWQMLHILFSIGAAWDDVLGREADPPEQPPQPD